jgi:hypothetical protein
LKQEAVGERREEKRKEKKGRRKVEHLNIEFCKLLAVGATCT